MTQERRLFEPYKRAQLAEAYDAIVIGTGIGGLAAAALLAKEGGKKVLMLERHYTVGGFTHVFNRPGYEWDVGVHYIGNLKPGSVLRAIFDEVSDGKLAWADMGDVYDRVIIGKDEFPLPKGARNLAKGLKERFPGEEKAIDRYFQLIKDALSTSLAFHAEKAMPGAIAALAGPFMRRKFLHYSDRTVREVLEELTQNQKLIGVLSAQFGDYGSPPAEASFMVHAMVADHYFEGGYYPVGGSGRIHETIIPVIQSAGGQVLINAEVKEVVVEHGRCTGVKMFDDRIIKAPLVVSDAGVVNTFGSLIPSPVAKQLGLLEKLQKVRPSPAHLCLYIGLKHSPEELNLPKSNFWIYPDEHHEKNLAAQKKGPGAPLPVLYVSFPAAKDPSFGERFPGRSTIDIITVAPYEWFSKWEDTRWKKRGEDYDALKAKLTEQMLDKLYEYVPQVKGKIDVAELSTPLTTKHFCNYQTGEIYGIDHTPDRFRLRWLKPATGVDGLYLTGQDIVTCGVAGALFGGVLTASAILKKNLVVDIVKRARTKRAAMPQPV